MRRTRFDRRAAVHVTSAGTTIAAHRSATATKTDEEDCFVSEKYLAKSLNRNWKDDRMKATIYHNPMCGTSRKTLDILRDSGCDLSVHEYLKDPPSREELKRLYERAGISPREGLRAKEPLAEELGLTRPDVSDDEILDAMMEHPVLIERPIVETANGVRLCRPQEKVREIL
jgi:arsenate reductase